MHTIHLLGMNVERSMVDLHVKCHPIGEKNEQIAYVSADGQYVPDT